MDTPLSSLVNRGRAFEGMGFPKILSVLAISESTELASFPKSPSGPKPKDTKPKTQTAGDDEPVEESDNTLYWVLGVTGGIAILGGAYFIIQKNKSNQI